MLLSKSIPEEGRSRKRFPFPALVIGTGRDKAQAREKKGNKTGDI